MKKFVVDESCENNPVTHKECVENRNGCNASWWRYVKFVGIIAGIFLTIIGTLATYFNSVDTKHGEAIAAVQLEVKGQQKDIEYVRRAADEIRENQLHLQECLTEKGFKHE